VARIGGTILLAVFVTFITVRDRMWRRSPVERQEVVDSALGER